MLASLAALASDVELSPLPAVDAPICARPQPGSWVLQPKDLHSVRGVLQVDLRIRGLVDATGAGRYCYEMPDGTQSPTLRLHSGDLLILHLRNELARFGERVAFHARHSSGPDACHSGVMSATSTNLHFHGLALPPACHADEVLKTSIQPEDPPFEYRFRVPPGSAPGLYWYHP